MITAASSLSAFLAIFFASVAAAAPVAGGVLSLVDGEDAEGPGAAAAPVAAAAADLGLPLLPPRPLSSMGEERSSEPWPCLLLSGTILSFAFLFCETLHVLFF